jgi:transcriptional regulator with XRE-family HTH domain
VTFASLRVSPHRLRALIDQAGYNFAEFAREVQVSKEALRGYTELGAASAPIKPEILRRIAGKLNVSADVLRVAEPRVSEARAFEAMEMIAKEAGLTDAQIVAHFKRLPGSPKRPLVCRVKSQQDKEVREVEIPANGR